MSVVVLMLSAAAVVTVFFMFFMMLVMYVPAVRAFLCPDAHAFLNAVANRLYLFERVFPAALKAQTLCGKIEAHLAVALCLRDFRLDF